MERSKSEVEMRISQEIKNHQDWMYKIGQAIQTLNESLVALSLRSEKIATQAASDNKQTLILFENLAKGVQEETKYLDQRVGDVESSVSILKQGCIEFEKDVVENNQIFERCWETIGTYVARICDLENDLKVSKDCFNKSLNTTKAQLVQNIQTLKEELTPKPQEPIKEQVEEKLKAIRVDFEGLIREISLLKQTVAYGDKKFENIYTWIERLKERIK